VKTYFTQTGQDRGVNIEKFQGLLVNFLHRKGMFCSGPLICDLTVHDASGGGAGGGRPASRAPARLRHGQSREARRRCPLSQFCAPKIKLKARETEKGAAGSPSDFARTER